MPTRDEITVTINREVIRRARAVARRRGIGLSALIEDRLRGLTAEEPTDMPIVSELRGILPRDAQVEAHRRHLQEKHAL